MKRAFAPRALHRRPIKRAQREATISHASREDAASTCECANAPKRAARAVSSSTGGASVDGRCSLASESPTRSHRRLLHAAHQLKITRTRLVDQRRPARNRQLAIEMEHQNARSTTTSVSVKGLNLCDWMLLGELIIESDSQTRNQPVAKVIYFCVCHLV